MFHFEFPQKFELASLNSLNEGRGLSLQAQFAQAYKEGVN